MLSQNSQPSEGEHRGPPVSSSEPTKVDFESLAKGSKEVLIYHAGQVYRLRLTKNGKLILNK